jgi:hypothetical protein
VVRAGVVGGKKARLRRSGGAGGGDDDGRRMIVGRDSTCLYAGGVVDPDRSGLCVGVFDRETKRLHLFPAASSSLRQSVAGYPNVSALARESASSALPAASSASAEGAATQVSTRTLLEDFGSAKKQRAYRSQEANRVSSESVLGSTLEEFLQSSGNRSGNNDANLLSDGDGNAEEAGAEDAVERATREWRRAFLPPFDESATDPMRVYMMEAFAGDEAWRYASKQASVLLRNKRSLESAPLGAGSVSAPAGGSSISDPNRYLPSILQVLKHLVLQGDASKKMYQIKCALLCQDLSRLYLQLQKSKFISRPHPEKNFYMGVPVEIATLFLEQFSTQIHDVGSRPGSVMTKPNLDKCRMHLLLLLLAAYGGTDVPVAGIAQDLHLDAKDAMYLLRLAGCAAGKKREGERRVSLPVPVTFPDAGRRKRGRGGGAGR